MNEATFARARSLADGLAPALDALWCRGHSVAVTGCAQPTFHEAKRFVEMSLWMPWRAPHVMLVPCVLTGDRPAVLVATWDSRGVVIRQTVTSAAQFEAEVAAAAATLRARSTEEELAVMRAQHRDGAEAPELENAEYWPEVLARVQAEAPSAGEPDDPGTPVAAPIAERIWPSRLEDLRELQRALDDH